MSAMSSIDRVLEKHGEEIRKRYEAEVPATLKSLFGRVELENNLYSIGVMWVFRDGSTLQGPAIDIDNLADDYPDCNVGY